LPPHETGTELPANFQLGTVLEDVAQALAQGRDGLGLEQPSGPALRELSISSGVGCDKRDTASQCLQERIGQIFVPAGHDYQVHRAIPLRELLVADIHFEVHDATGGLGRQRSTDVPLLLTTPDNKQAGLRYISRNLREGCSEKVDALQVRQTADVAQHDVTVGPSQGGTHQGCARRKSLSFQSERQFAGLIAQERARANQGVVMRANGMHGTQKAGTFSRDRAWEEQYRRTMPRDLTGHNEIAMHVHSIEIVPAVRELVFNPPLKPSFMPREGAPLQSLLHPVPVLSQTTVAGNIASNRRERCLPQITRPVARDWDRLEAR
jgi:hypothetical protein